MKTSCTISVELAAKLDAAPLTHPAFANRRYSWQALKRSERLELLVEYALARATPAKAAKKSAKR